MSRATAPAAAALAAALTWLVPFQLIGLWSAPGITDLPTYQRIAGAIADGAVPYRDVDIEYPPLATALFWLADHLPGGYATAFSGLMMVSLCLTAAGVVATAQALGMSVTRRVAAGAVVALSPLLLGNLVATRFDLTLSAVLAWTVFAAVTARWRTMWALLAVGVLLKLVPLAFIPVLMVWHAHRADRRAAVVGAGGALAGVALVVAPLVAVTPSGMWHVVAYHLDRPPQIESMASTYMLLLHQLADVPLTVMTSFGSQGLQGEGPAVIAAISTGLAVVLVGAVAVATAVALRRARQGRDARVVVAGVAATTAVLLVTGKVLSPQFMVWLLPAVLLVGGRYGRGATATCVAALVATQLYFPRRYFDLVALQDTPILLLAARNTILIALLALCWPRTALAAPPPSSPLGSRAPGAPEVTGPEHAVRARYLMD